MKKGNKSSTILFLVLIFGISIVSMLTPVKGYSTSENRVLQQRPEFTWKTFLSGAYIKDYEKFVSDQFVGRDAWIGLKTYTELALQKQDINGVYFGKHDYFIEKLEDADINKEQMTKNENRLVAFMKKFEQKLGDKHVYAMIVPTAFDVLSEYLPPFATGFDQGRFIDRLSNEIGDNFIDLRPILNEHQDEYIYYKTDHHWTTLGAYYAYETWAKKAGLTPLSQEDFNIELLSDEFLGTLYSKINIPVSIDSMYAYNMDRPYQVEYNLDGKIKNSLYETKYLQEKDKYSVYLNGNNSVVKITSDIKNGKTLLIIKDSYAHCFAPFAANHFETVYMVDLRYFNMPMSQFIEQFNVTDVLVLYNTIGFVQDKNTLYLGK